MPQSRRNIVALLSLWQPVGVVVASAIAYGTAAKYRCDIELLSCRSPELLPGQACCTVSSNMGWRYEVIVLGGMTLLVFCLRFFVFPFHESPKFLVAKGREQEAIDVLHKIAKFNRAPPPTLTLAHFAEIDQTSDDAAYTAGPLTSGQLVTRVIRNTANSFRHLKLLFTNKLQLTIFGLLAVAYMVSLSNHRKDR